MLPAPKRLRIKNCTYVRVRTCTESSMSTAPLTQSQTPEGSQKKKRIHIHGFKWSEAFKRILSITIIFSHPSATNLTNARKHSPTRSFVLAWMASASVEVEAPPKNVAVLDATLSALLVAAPEGTLYKLRLESLHTLLLRLYGSIFPKKFKDFQELFVSSKPSVSILRDVEASKFNKTRERFGNDSEGKQIKNQVKGILK